MVLAHDGEIVEAVYQERIETLARLFGFACLA